MPMTSPVDCMNGPTDGSTPLSLAVENAGALTATNGGSATEPGAPAQLRERRAERDPDGQLDHRHARDLGQERHRPRGARVDLDQVHAVVADDELGVDQAARAEREADPLHRRTRSGRGRPPRRAAAGTRAIESPEWTPARSTCSSRPGDQHAVPVADGVDVDLDALEEAVDAHRPVGVDDRGRGEVTDEVLGRVGEVDGEPADDERRAGR